MQVWQQTWSTSKRPGLVVNRDLGGSINVTQKYFVVQIPGRNHREDVIRELLGSLSSGNSISIVLPFLLPLCNEMI